MKKRANRIAFMGQVERRHEANTMLTEPGATVLVHRGVARSLAMACPDGCGEQLTINLDERAGPAWRIYSSKQELSIFPSVWRDTGCRSHFIVWRSKIYWCDWDELDTPSEETLQEVLAALPDKFTPYTDLADSLELVPWAVLTAARRLVQMGLAERDKGDRQAMFRRNQTGRHDSNQKTSLT